MSLQNEIRWVHHAHLVSEDFSEDPFFAKDHEAVLPVAALRARLEAELDPDWDGNETIVRLLAELEGQP